MDARGTLRKAASKEDHESEYGSNETYAEPGRHAYPLTKDGKPSRERTMAAWRYANMPRNGVSGSVKATIRRFAKEHFDLDLHGRGDARKALRRSRSVFKCEHCGHSLAKCPSCGM